MEQDQQRYEAVYKETLDRLQLIAKEGQEGRTAMYGEAGASLAEIVRDGRQQSETTARLSSDVQELRSDLSNAIRLVEDVRQLTSVCQRMGRTFWGPSRTDREEAQAKLKKLLNAAEALVSELNGRQVPISGATTNGVQDMDKSVD
jgi:hypothetical protein